MAITSLFGPTPAQIADARQQQMEEQIAGEGRELGPFRGLYQAARRLGSAGGQSLVSGLFPEAADPALREAQAVEQIRQKYTGMNMTDPKVLQQMAVELGPVAPNAAFRLAQTARQLAPEMGKPLTVAPGATLIDPTTGKVIFQAPATERGGKFVQVDLGDRIQLRDPATGQVIEEVRKGVTPAQRERIAEQQEQEKPGFIGKTGAYRNKFGEVIPATEMSKQRQGFVQAQDLLAKLNRIDYDTVKKAQSPFDYTEPGITKTIGSQVASSTVNAQTTIAATQLLEQIEKLPPGSASDADMRAAIRDFPGYGNAENLANWVNRTKETLGESLARQNELYGFPVQVKATPKIGPKKKEQQQSTSEWRVVPND
jgi:hypothetical protein